MRDRPGIAAGIVFLFVGGYLLLERYTHLSGPGPLVLLLGAIFLVISALRGFSGPLLPGCVLSGLGTGLLLQDRLARWMPGWGVLLLGLGAGFLLVALVDALEQRARRPSPLLPGLVLTGIAIGSLLARAFLVRLAPVVHLARLWPWALLLAGIFLILRSLSKR
jgi:hypothetical protein